MSSDYNDIEAGIYAVLTSADGEDPSPFKRVEPGLDGLSEEQLGNLINGLAGTAPAAGILYAGGENANDRISYAREAGHWLVIVVAAARTRSAAVGGDTQTTGTRELLRWVFNHLHGIDSIKGIVNPLKWVANERFQLPNFPLSVAAMVARFEAAMYY